MNEFKTPFAEHIFRIKYAQGANDTWADLSKRCVDDVCKDILTSDECDQLETYIRTQKFIPGGRYLYYAGRTNKSYNNCFLLKGEYDTREEWGNLVKKASDCLMSGGGIGIEYSVFRPEGAVLQSTGGRASGPIPLMCSVNEVGRNVMQGGARRSAIWAGLNWQHPDVGKFLTIKDWHHTMIPGTQTTLWDAKVAESGTMCRARPRS